MKLDLLLPHAPLTMDVVLAEVSRVYVGASERSLSLLTATELAIVYDWARRERFPSLGPRRDRPSCLDLATIMSSLSEELSDSMRTSDAALAGRVRSWVSRRGLSSSPEPSQEVSAPASSDRDPAPSGSVGGDPASGKIGVLAPWVDHRVCVDFVVEMPLGDLPTPTMEAAEAAALAVAGPGHRLSSGSKVVIVNAFRLWEMLAPVGNVAGVAARSRIHRVLVDGGVTSPEIFRAQSRATLTKMRGMGSTSLRSLARSGCLRGLP